MQIKLIKKIGISFALAAMGLLIPGNAMGQVKKVSGQYTYYGDKNDSPAMSKRKALEGARLDALSKEFGTIVSQDILQADRVGSDGETSKFFSLSATEVKGEWIADEGNPVFVVSLDGDDNLVVNCRINGTAKAITNESVDFEAIALRNGNNKGNASSEYKSGDNLMLYVTAPVNGEISVFLLDEAGDVTLMLPYGQDMGQEALIKKGYDYVFFDESKNEGTFGAVDSFMLYTNGQIEFNKLFVVFSPNQYNLPLSRVVEDGRRLIKEDDFTKWLVKNRRNDPKMSVKQINLKILPE